MGGDQYGHDGKNVDNSSASQGLFHVDFHGLDSTAELQVWTHVPTNKSKATRETIAKKACSC
jgi:hypothetical protein